VKNRFLAILMLMGTVATTAFAAEGGRQVLVIAPSVYPVMARQLHVGGTVRMQAVVSSTGKIKELKVIGGHPLLTEAALDSARKWQFQPSATETVEVIAINYKR
jgi:TonB family protein